MEWDIAGDYLTKRRYRPVSRQDPIQPSIRLFHVQNGLDLFVALLQSEQDALDRDRGRWGTVWIFCGIFPLGEAMGVLDDTIGTPSREMSVLLPDILSDRPFRLRQALYFFFFFRPMQ